MNKKKFTISEAARILNVHPNTLRNWEKKNVLIPQRDKRSNYRYYSHDQINAFLLRGATPKIKIHWGYEYSKQARRDELTHVKKTLDVIVSSEVSTYEKELDKELFSLWESLIARGVKGRFIRDLDNPRMREIAAQHKKFGVKTKDRKVTGVTISIRDRKVTRIEVPSDNPEQRLNLIINDPKVAKSFTLLFEKVWNST